MQNTTRRLSLSPTDICHHLSWTMIMSDQLYHTLDASKQEIRLLEISHDHGKDGDNEPCRLVMSTHSLQDIGLEYIAISYVWSAGDLPDAMIVVNDHETMVGGNLHALLLRLQDGGFEKWPLGEVENYTTREILPNHVRRFWVDAISINQQDVHERNSTVQMMGQIYTEAYFTIGWLGEGHSRVEAVMPQLAELYFTIMDAVHLRKNEYGVPQACDWVKAEDSHIWRSDPLDLTQEETLLFANVFWASILALCTNSYWYRAWTYQETVLSTALKLCAGPSCLDLVCLSTLSNAVGWLRSSPDDLPDFVDERVGSHLFYELDNATSVLAEVFQCYSRQEFQYNKRRRGTTMLQATKDEAYAELLALVVLTQGRRAADPRDKLYSLLGFLEREIKPGYDRSVEDVYTEFTKECFRPDEVKSLDILAHVGAFSLSFVNETLCHRLFLPSWVVNWDMHSNARGSLWLKDGEHAIFQDTPLFNFADWNYRSLENIPNTTFEVNGRILRIRGVVQDEISLSCRSNEDDSVAHCSDCEKGSYPTAGSYRDEEFNSRMLHFCDHVMGGRRMPRYPVSNMTTLEALARMHVLDRSPTQRMPLSHPETALQDPELGERLLEISWVLDAWGTTTAITILIRRDKRASIECIIEDMEKGQMERFLEAKKIWRRALGFEYKGTVDADDMIHHVLGPRNNRSMMHRMSRRKRMGTWLRKAKSYVKEQEPNLRMTKHVFGTLSTLSRHNSAMQTRDGLIGWGPADATPGDIVVVAMGCPMPLILRHIGDSKYHLIGACWVLGLMNGEAVKAVKEGMKPLQTMDIV